VIDTVPSMTTFEQWAARADPQVVEGLRLAVHDEGDGPVMTFLHGYPSSSLDVVPLWERLADEARLVTLDLPGFGASAKPVDHEYTIHGATDAVEAVWAELGVGSTIVVAHDYSVSIAQELLARRLDDPARGATITGVVWCNGGLWSDLHRQTLGQQMLLDPEHGAAVAQAMDEAALTSGLQGTWGTRRPMSEAESHGIWRSMEHDGGSKIAHRLLHYVADRVEHGPRWIDALEISPVPMRFVWGDLDPVSGGHVADRMEDRLPGWPPGRELLRLPDVGHWPPLEAPDEVAAAVKELL
jgi:pimeloyl-ACP methyl ester carboxylesterase